MSGERISKKPVEMTSQFFLPSLIRKLVKRSKNIFSADPFFALCLVQLRLGNHPLVNPFHEAILRYAPLATNLEPGHFPALDQSLEGSLRYLKHRRSFL